METFFKILQIILPTILSFVIGWLSSQLKKRKQQKEDSESYQQALIWVLRWVSKKSLIEDAKWYIENGITPEELKEFNEAFENYRVLGGNGEAKIYWEQVQNIPPKIK